MELRAKVIRLAYEKPELRPVLLPLLTKQAGPTLELLLEDSLAYSLEAVFRGRAVLKPHGISLTAPHAGVLDFQLKTVGVILYVTVVSGGQVVAEAHYHVDTDTDVIAKDLAAKLR